MRLDDQTRQQLAELNPPPLHRSVFVNRNLRMDQIKAIGLDMDYTLARYNKIPIETLAHRLTAEKLIQRGYPKGIIKIGYDPKFVIRGLTVDKELGNILKLDRHNHVGRAFHGRTEISKEERRELYRRERLSFVPPRFALVDTLFAMPEVCLYADLIDFLEEQGEHCDPWKLFDDIRECIDEAHRDGTLKEVVKANLGEYVERDPMLAKTLHKLRSSGKKLFIVTNSYGAYTKAMMSYLLDGELPEYPKWTKYFDAVVVGSKKPSFFTGREPFALLDEEGNVQDRSISQLEKGRLYEGGNLKDLETMLDVSGEEVLYVGDHIYGDILRSKKASLWRTALIVEELEDELLHTRQIATDIQTLHFLNDKRRKLDERANLQRGQLSIIEKALGTENAKLTTEFEEVRKARDETKKELRQVLEDLAKYETKVSQSFNANWGMVFKEIGENSRFGEQVVTYACIYTSRVSNFLGYSTYQYFRGPSDLMPHERG